MNTIHLLPEFIYLLIAHLQYFHFLPLTIPYVCYPYHYYNNDGIARCYYFAYGLHIFLTIPKLFCLQSIIGRYYL